MFCIVEGSKNAEISLYAIKSFNSYKLLIFATASALKQLL